MNDNQQSAAATSAAAFDNHSYSSQVPPDQKWLRGGLDETACGEPSVERTTLVDVNYDRWRASEERTAALQARDPKVRRVHLDLAERYEERVRRSIPAARSELCL
jgi:hypothetical protein